MFPIYTKVRIKQDAMLPEFEHMAGGSFLFFGLVAGDSTEAVVFDYGKQCFMQLVPLSMLEAE
tara:strand:+ start:1533 stop:1721 length:189 start_codon:yes stop_codon:yes gene_type:complete